MARTVPVRILVVDDHLIVREGLRWLLGQDEEVEIAGEAATADEAMRTIPDVGPDVVLLDLHLPDRSGLEVLREVRDRFPDVPVVILTMSDQPEYVEEAVQAGAAGYLVKNAPQAELSRAIHAAAAGAASVHLLDSSAHALERAVRNAELSGLSDRISTEAADALER